jgi:hypothetical protein
MSACASSVAGYARAYMGKTLREWHVFHADVGLIDARGGPYIYTQGIDPYYSFVKVAGYGTAPTGAYVKTSGAFSGERSGIKVVNAYATYGIWAWGTFWELDGSIAEKTDHSNAVGEGDSGGPVFTTQSDGRAVANGIISAIDTDTRTSCTGITQVRDQITGNVRLRICAWRMAYARMAQAVGTCQDR